MNIQAELQIRIKWCRRIKIQNSKAIMANKQTKPKKIMKLIILDGWRLLEL
jgi:hypothetical protein